MSKEWKDVYVRINKLERAVQELQRRLGKWDSSRDGYVDYEHPIQPPAEWKPPHCKKCVNFDKEYHEHTGRNCEFNKCENYSMFVPKPPAEQDKCESCKTCKNYPPNIMPICLKGDCTNYSAYEPKCKTCGGMGNVERPLGYAGAKTKFIEPCPDCQPKEDKCKSCIRFEDTPKSCQSCIDYYNFIPKEPKKENKCASCTHWINCTYHQKCNPTTNWIKYIPKEPAKPECNTCSLFNTPYCNTCGGRGQIAVRETGSGHWLGAAPCPGCQTKEPVGNGISFRQPIRSKNNENMKGNYEKNMNPNYNPPDKTAESRKE